MVKPRNVIVQWTAPQVQIKREFKYLGVIRANPGEYVNRYRSILKTSHELPGFVKEIPTPHGVKLASDQPVNPVYELEGDVSALQLIDLDHVGLSEYKPQVNKLTHVSSGTSYSVNSALPPLPTTQKASAASSVFSGFNYNGLTSNDYISQAQSNFF